MDVIDPRALSLLKLRIGLVGMVAQDNYAKTQEGRKDGIGDLLSCEAYVDKKGGQEERMEKG